MVGAPGTPKRCMYAAACARHDAAMCPFMQAMAYGFLTCLNGTYFIKRTGHHEYEFTNVIKPFDTDPTVLEMLMCE